MKRKLRQPYYGNYKLHENEVVEIYHLVKVADLPRKEIADHFEISTSHVSNIGARRFWQHVLGRR